MTRTILILALLVPAAALAQPARAPAPMQMKRGAPPTDEERAELRERVIRRIRTMRAVDIADILSLDEAQAIQLARRLAPYDEKRIELRLAMHESMKALKAAAHGDGDAVRNVADASRRIFDAQAELGQIQKREFEDLSKGLPPEKVARLAVYLHQFDKRIMKMAREVRHGRGGPGGPMGMPTPPPDWDED
jgi:hypothetical protein